MFSFFGCCLFVNSPANRLRTQTRFPYLKEKTSTGTKETFQDSFLWKSQTELQWNKSKRKDGNSAALWPHRHGKMFPVSPWKTEETNQNNRFLCFPFSWKLLQVHFQTEEASEADLRKRVKAMERDGITGISGNSSSELCTSNLQCICKVKISAPSQCDLITCRVEAEQIDGIVCKEAHWPSSSSLLTPISSSSISRNLLLSPSPKNKTELTGPSPAHYKTMKCSPRRSNWRENNFGDSQRACYVL